MLFILKILSDYNLRSTTMRDTIYDHGKYAHEEGFRTHTFVPAGLAICVDPLRLYD